MEGSVWKPTAAMRQGAGYLAYGTPLRWTARGNFATSGAASQNIGKSFIKSYAAVCLEGAIIVLACIIFSLFAASPPVVNPDASAVTMVWGYIGELVFNILVLVGAVKMADRVVREMMGL